MKKLFVAAMLVASLSACGDRAEPYPSGDSARRDIDRTVVCYSGGVEVYRTEIGPSTNTYNTIFDGSIFIYRRGARWNHITITADCVITPKESQ